MRLYGGSAVVCLLALSASANAGTQASSITLSPATTTLRVNQKKTFSATTHGTVNKPLVWKVVSTAPTSSGDLGMVGSDGTYTAPAAVPTPNTVLVEAFDATNSQLFGSATVTLQNPTPAITSLAPSSINTGLAYAIAVKGSGFTAASQVQWNGSAVASTFVSSGEIDLSGTSTLAAGTKISVTVVNPDPGGSTSGARTLSVMAPVGVTVSPANKTLRIGQTQTFSAHVTNNSNTPVTWQVNGTTGGDSTHGTIDAKGVYTAPAVLPPVTTTQPGPTASTNAAPLPSVTITAISVADPTAAGSVALNLENAVPTITSVTPNPINSGSQAITITGTGFAQGATISFAGAALPTTFSSPTQLTATATISLPAGGIAAVKVVNPTPGSAASNVIAVPVSVAAAQMSYSDAARFLRLATWGPTPAGIEHLQTIGRDAWLAEQFAAPPVTWPDPNSPSEGVRRLQDAFFTNALTGSDQLRQRVAFALAEILVSSSEKDMHFTQMVSYQRLLGNDAFGSYRALLGDMTLNPAMGYFLDMVNNDKANPAKNTVANENYARESMQLFSIGLVQLNMDGTAVQNAPPEYTQDVVTQMAKVYTGWTYAPAPGYASQWKNPEYDFAPMIAFEAHHDTTQKVINLPIPCTIAAGGTAANDLNQALDCLFQQANIAPFISYRLIQRLVKSSPSPAYVSNVANVFKNTNGNLQAVVTSILTDPEAQTEGSGKLNEPVLYATQLLRMLNAQVTTSATGVTAQTQSMGQDVLDAPSVFSYFSPFYRVPGVVPPPVAPEFQIMNAETALARVNFAFRAVSNQLSGNIKIDFSNWQDLASDAATLADAINNALYRGEMTSSEINAVIAGAKASTNALTSVRDAVYVAAGAPQYMVQQ